ncbi:hypothetical protein [Nitrosomonas sp. HPC101]|uniref:hypothetical protein n=1 Tax=Nitrosomonas sp. HPC101 TaxID=1658667 RepID=UPI00136E2093|nr:hypothetical protein [Nitrosomonas sp. HPC101]
MANASGELTFRYLQGTEDYEAAIDAGFKGFPAFRGEAEEFSDSVLNAFIRRLPPRNREDFDDFLALHRLPSPFTHSDMALLAYTGAKLPSDGFSLVPDFIKECIPCDFLMEIAGVRHVFRGDISRILEIGDPVSFLPDEHNIVDRDAIFVVCRGQNIGYVNRVMRENFNFWLKHYDVVASIERLNGKPDRPLVYIRVGVS